jgi:hypothetical protein
MSVRTIFPLLSILALAPVGCSAAHGDEPVGSNEQKAVVTAEQATRAYEIARGIDYLPWGYTADGCYARALYMSMELAAERIPSSSQYIVATGGGVLDPGGGTQWSWHVAPMIKITASGTPMIIDPSLFAAPEVAHSLASWVTRNNPTPINQYATYLIQGSHYWKINELVDTTPIGSFAELDPFHGADINSACGVAWNYIGREAPMPSPNAMATKRSSLVARTRSLITSLRGVGKLDDITAATLDCEGHATAPAPPAMPAQPEQQQPPQDDGPPQP